MKAIKGKHKWTWILLVWICLCSITSFAQQNNIEGRVYQDLDLSCTYTNGDISLSGITIRASLSGSNNVHYYGTTDASGYYSIVCPAGTYTVTKETYTPYVSQNCVPFGGVVTSQVSDTIDFALEVTKQCPLMTVDVSVPILEASRPSTYAIQYCNNGTQTAQNVEVELEIDTFLNVQSFSVPPISQSGNSYIFNIGTVGIAQCGFIYMDVQVDTSAILGQTHCIEAYIRPDSLCTNGSNWWVNIEGTCRNDSVLFKIENLSTVSPQYTPYWVFEDDLIMRTGGVSVPSGMDTVIGIAAQPRKFYRIEMGDMTQFPDSVFSAFVEGCVPDVNGDFNVGFPTQYFNGNNSPTSAIDCQQNGVTFMDAHKIAQPKGYGANHYINSGQYIDYQINFQNTGTDTVTSVTIIDTLSPNLALSRIQITTASHPYTWELKKNGILEIHFTNIMLPSNTVNRKASYGFVKIRVPQFSSPGTVVDGFAEVYFDQNTPTLTNFVFHEIALDFYTIGIIPIGPIEPVQLTAYPNPFQNNITIDIEEEEKELRLVVYDLMGRQVAQVSDENTNQITLERNNLEEGIYVFSLFVNDKLIGTGKIIAK